MIAFITHRAEIKVDVGDIAYEDPENSVKFRVSSVLGREDHGLVAVTKVTLYAQVSWL